MPFGESVKVSPPARKTDDCVNFTNVYEKLLKPALDRAGCLPLRADTETTPGDIRIDMFYDLLTADVVVADVSAPDANVFYELGIRDGMCPRGVFLVRGDWPWVPPFDIAPDRTLIYRGKFFTAGTEAAPQDGLEDEVKRLGGLLKEAIRNDWRHGSPVYQHLPGLVPPVWKDVQIPKARFFMNLQDEWAERVRLALEKGRPGNILTLAHDVPNRVERSHVLFTAAKALIGLCRYDAAEEILRETLSLDQDHRDARLHLGIVLENLGRISDAQHEIEKIRDDAYANADLGHVYRTLWRLKWRDQTGTTQDARQLARDNVILAAKAHDAFRQALEMDPRSYFSGLNAVLLLAIVDDLFDGKRPSEFGSDSVGDLIQIVSFIAQSAKRRAEQGSDDDDQFWSTTSLAALALLKGNEQEAHQLVRDACALPQTTLFQKEMLKVRLQLLQELGFKADFAGSAIGLIAKSTKKTKRYRNVILFYEHDTAPSGVQFTNDMADSIRQQIDDRLSRWNIGEGDLAICSPLREGDILFAEACRERKADVRLLVLDVPMFSGSNSSNWENRYQELASVAENWRYKEELGDPPDFDARESHNRWVLNTAHMEAYAESNSKLFGLILWNGEDVPPGSSDPSSPGYFVEGIRSYPRYQGLVEAITAAKGEPPRSAVAAV